MLAPTVDTALRDAKAKASMECTQVAKKLTGCGLWRGVHGNTLNDDHLLAARLNWQHNQHLPMRQVFMLDSRRVLVGTPEVLRCWGELL